MSRSHEWKVGPGPRSAQPLGRRDFMALGALAAALPVAAQAGSVAPSGALPSALSVGYWDGEAGRGALRSAEALVAGDAGFRQRGVRLSVLGLVGPRPRELQAVNLVSHFSLPGTPETVDVVHWGMRALPTDSIASISDQVVATGSDAALRLTLEVRYAHEAQKRSYPLVLSGGWNPGAAKLRRGTYALAFDHTASAPRWADHSAWLPQDSPLPQLTAEHCACLLLAVDYAG